MPQTQTATVAQRSKLPILPDAFYRPADIEDIASYTTLRRAVKAGRLQPSYAGKNLLFKGSALLKWLEK